jgi:hypothetical protein
MSMDVWSPQAITGLNPGTAPATTSSGYGGMGIPGISRSAGPAAHETAPLWSHENPMFWVGVFLLVTIGAVAANANIRVAKFKAGGSAGTV